MHTHSKENYQGQGTKELAIKGTLKSIEFIFVLWLGKLKRYPQSKIHGAHLPLVAMSEYTTGCSLGPIFAAIYPSKGPFYYFGYLSPLCSLRPLAASC